MVDNSTVTYDSKRDRLLMVRKPYGDKQAFDGVLYALDLKTLEASRIEPAERLGRGHPVPLPAPLRPCPRPVLAGCTLPPDDAGRRRTPAFDCAAGRWVTLNLGGDDPSGPKGRNVSLGLVHDAKRGLFWAVDAKSNVFVLKLDPDKAGRADIR